MNLRKYLISAFILLLSGFSAMAQERGWDLALQVGTGMYDFNFPSYRGAGSDLYDLYEPETRVKEGTGILLASATAMYYLKPWLKIGGSLNVSSPAYTRVVPISGEKVGEGQVVRLSLVPEVLFPYCRWRHVQLYSGLGVGVEYDLGTLPEEGGSRVRPVYQIVPIGARFGNWGNAPIYISYELNFGSHVYGARFGVGLHF